MRIKSKMLIGIISPLVIAFAVLVYITYNSSINSVIRYSESTSTKESNKISTILTNYSKITSTILSSYHSKYFINPEQRRTFFSGFLKDVLVKHSELFGTWSTFEENKLDGLDKININKNASTKSGKFSPYWVRKDGQIVLIESNDVDKNSSDYDFYTIPFNTQKIHIPEPYLDPDAGIYLTSVCQPIVENGKSIGVIGVDLTLTNFTEIVNSIKPFKGSYATIIDNTGKVIIHNNKDYIGKGVNEIPNFISQEYSQLLLTQLAQNSNFYEELTTDKGDYMVFSQPILVNSSKFGWNLTLFVPKSELMTDVYNILILIIVIRIVLIIAIWVISENIGKSVNISFERIKNISEGKF